MNKQHLKVSSGSYVNLYYEVGYKSITNTPIDIMIILPEYMGNEFDIDDIQERVETVLYGIPDINDSVQGIQEELDDAFIDEDWQIYVMSAR